MNIPTNPDDTDSFAIGSETPVPSGAPSAASDAVSVVGFSGVEFVMALQNNIGGDPVTEMSAVIEYRDTSSLTWFPVTSEQIASGGSAPQDDYGPERVFGGYPDVWRLPVPKFGTEMRIRGYSTAGTPDPTSVLEYRALRKSS